MTMIAHNLSSEIIILSGFNFTTAQAVCITAMISHIFISFSAVQMYGFSYIPLYSSPSSGILGTHKVASSQLV